MKRSQLQQKNLPRHPLLIPQHHQQKLHQQHPEQHQQKPHQQPLQQLIQQKFPLI